MAEQKVDRKITWAEFTSNLNLISKVSKADKPQAYDKRWYRR